jgi:hypothetical protein
MPSPGRHGYVMANFSQILNKQMLFHLDAASAHAEELGETHIRELIDLMRELAKARALRRREVQ